MVRCYRCGSEECVKSGLLEGLQRFRCKKCGNNFVDKPRRGYGPVAVATAVWLHLSGMSQRKIAALFSVTPAAVRKWIKDFTPPEDKV